MLERNINYFVFCGAAKTTVHSETSSSMEFVKETIKHASEADRVALRAEKKSYSYLQLISSALDISSILRTNVRKFL